MVSKQNAISKRNLFSFCIQYISVFDHLVKTIKLNAETKNQNSKRFLFKDQF